MVQNRGIIFKKVPSGWPVAGQDLVLEDRDFDLDAAPPSGGVTVRNIYASFDPYQRGRMRPAHVKSYNQPFELDKPISNSTVARVLKSDNEKYKPGDLIKCFLPTEEYSSVSKGLLEAFGVKLDNEYNLDPAMFIGPIGMPGLTAYSSLYDIGKPKKGETIFISSASGAVGQIVGQLAKHEGLTVVGSVGDDEKLKFITEELGFDAGFNYKKEKPLDALKRLAPKGIDIYYDNVGGEQLEAAIETANDFGRIVACGAISQYNLKSDERWGIKNMTFFVSKRLLMRGFIVTDPNMDVYAKEHLQKVSQWIHDGSFKAKIHVTDGIENGIDGFLGMLAGKNFGKAILKISDPNVSSKL